LIQLHGWSRQELANFLGFSKQHIENYFRLFELDPTVQEALADEKISEGHARSLHTLQPEQQIKVLEQILEQQLSVKGVQKLVQAIKRAGRPAKKENKTFEKESKMWKKCLPNCKVSFNGTPKNGSMVIKWSNDQDFLELIKLRSNPNG